MRLLAEIPYKIAAFNFRMVFIFGLCCAQVFGAQELLIEPDMGATRLIYAIEHASSAVNLVMYGFTDQEFVRALITAKARGNSVKVLLQEHPYKALDENEKVISALQQADIGLAWPDDSFKLTHQKTLLIDHQAAIVMTFNLTHTTFTKERNFALVLSDPALVDEIQQVYDADWQHKPVTVHQADLVWSPDNSREKLLALINSAKETIEIYAESVTDYQIVGAMAAAAHKGVAIKVLTSLATSDSSTKQLAYLEKAGATVRFDKKYIIHAKVMIIDGKEALIGSINLTSPSITQNRELSVITHEQAIIQKLQSTFNADWEQAVA
jgi:cardiolipin synthase